MFGKVRALQSLSKITRSILVKQLAPTSKVSIVHSPRLLHLKTFDNDAVLEKKRAANTILNVDENEYESDQNVLSDNQMQKEKKRFNQTLLKSQDDVENMSLATGVSNEDPDVFGNAPKEPIPEDEGDIQQEEYESRPTRAIKKLRTKEYAMMIKEHLNNNRIKEAIDVLEVRMCKEDRVKPENYIYNLLISGCAKAGYTRKAFSLYTKMRQRGLKVKESTYTSLFNACATAPSRQDGLTRAIRLKESLLENGYEFNVRHYNVMIKTFGRWGDVKTAYILADEMMDKNLPMGGETFNFLLQACASDEKHGFRHCLLTWHKMLEKNVEPDYYSFNAVLRCVRDCGMGDIETMEKVLAQILKGDPTKYMLEKGHDAPLISPTAKDDEESSTKNIALTQSNAENSLQIENDATSLEMPNLLAPRPHLGSMVSLSEVEKPHERFLLLGGLTGFLELMKSKNITPDIETFTTMLEVIPPTKTAEKQLITYIRKIGLKADIDFFNILIKKRAMRFDYEGGKEVLSMIQTAGLYPDIVTYGVLALGCTTVEASRELLEQMRHNDIKMNIQILGAMLRQGCAQKNFSYICEIMQISLDENVRPNDIFLRHLHKFYLECARAIDARHYSTRTKSFKKQHKVFCDKYRLYQEELGIDGLKLEDAIKKIKERPYSQYKEEEVDGVEPLKNEKLAKRSKLRKYIKKIKIKDLEGDDNHLNTDTKLLYTHTSRSNKLSSKSSNDKQDEEKQSIPPQLNLNNPFKIVHS